MHLSGGGAIYEWDENKRLWTLRTRGLGFAGMDRFDWDTALIEQDTRRAYGEVRYVAFGYIDRSVAAVCFTRRGENVRIISLRRASGKERRLYDECQTQASDE